MSSAKIKRVRKHVRPLFVILLLATLKDVKLVLNYFCGGILIARIFHSSKVGYKLSFDQDLALFSSRVKSNISKLERSKLKSCCKLFLYFNFFKFFIFNAIKICKKNNESAFFQIEDSIDFIQLNFSEMNKLWVRMQHQVIIQFLRMRDSYTNPYESKRIEPFEIFGLTNRNESNLLRF